MELKISSFSSLHYLLIILRVILLLVPQTGYIHPDEFFQSIEIFVGRIFEVEHNPPWEFNATFPIRSAAIPICTVGLSYNILKIVDLFLGGYFKVIGPYSLLIAPRLLICILSFTVDYCLYKICSENNEKCKSRRLVLASSYVMIVYGTRTFSNTLELILFAYLLYFVSESLVFSNILTRQKEYLNYRYYKSKTPAEKAVFHKYRLYLASDSLRHCLQISSIVVLGFFNRPTFLAFALFPVFFWLYRGMGSKLTIKLKFYIRLLIFALSCIPATVFVIMVDSFFYGYLTWGELGMLDVSLNHFVFTPINFVRYNLDPKNLAQHGLHPRYVHALVNIPLLFNVLALCGFCSLGQHILDLLNGKYNRLPTMRSIKGLMTLSAVAPVLLLSVFPHQEPRFLIPIVVPLVYLYGAQVLPEPETVLIKVDGAPKKKNVKKQSYSIFKLWLSINVVFVIIFGFLHQGAVYSLTSHLEREIRTPNTEFHIVTSHIYSIPQSLLLHPSSSKLYLTRGVKYSLSKKVFLYEEGSNLNSAFRTTYEVFENLRFKNKKNSNIKYVLYFVIPSSLDFELFSGIGQNLTLFGLETFYPHLSIEAFPFLSHYCLDLFANFDHCSQHNTLNIYNYIAKYLQLFGLKLYSIEAGL